MIVRFALFTSNGEAATPGKCGELPMSIAVLRVKKKNPRKYTLKYCKSVKSHSLTLFNNIQEVKETENRKTKDS